MNTSSRSCPVASGLPTADAQRPNAERNAEIIRRRLAGEWPSDIRREMGLSRNIVAGVLNRVGMCDPKADKRPSCLKYGPKGSNVGTSKLTEATVRYLRTVWRPWDRSRSIRVLAAEYGVHPRVMWSALRGKTWKHVA